MSTTFAAAREKVSSTRSCVTSPSAVANDGTLERVSPGHPGNPGNDIALRALMVAYQRGDLEAFEQFYVALEPELRQVPPDGRRAFLLHHWRGLSFREIAARLGIAPGAAKLRSSRAGSRLRHLLRGDEGESGD